ncbi:hypothetical protein RM780_16090 [Streptomyces sp. DSM 44917]|uniref:Uncharacterized protein n=1 Tax=Streptomyces boetiae TaxID=3075541 RepID=A0ABU2LB87_9ACTN|nr:hypothetical protein [Streptomyces sp. DSM 44917]MDT0308468.1 hypothetical protein [Streptomyces sp. DSM 44917]
MSGGGGDAGEATFRTVVRGEPIEVPATIDGIRATLSEDEADAFDREVGRTPATRLPLVLTRWALLHTGAREEDDEVVARLRRGDFSGCVPGEDLPESGAA